MMKYKGFLDSSIPRTLGVDRIDGSFSIRWGPEEDLVKGVELPDYIKGNCSGAYGTIEGPINE